MTPPRATFDSSAPAPTASRPSTARLLWESIERDEPGTLAKYGVTDASVDAPGKSLEQAVEAGWIPAEEMRMIQGVASEEDLIALDYTPTEIAELLEEQRVRACASST
jgi:hypothetical protein